MKRAALVATVSLVALIGAGSPEANAAGSIASWWAARAAPAKDTPSNNSSKRKHKSERPSEAKSARDADKAPPPKGPLHIIVSIEKQRATLFADGEPYASTKISTGMPGHPTPMGVFSVIQKSRHHISNLYDAPMPYMQRITWSGSALHEGPLPGHPASHGCIRLSPEFAQLLWRTTRIGARVIITRDEVKPEPIENPRLDALVFNASQAARAPDPAPTSAVIKIADAGAMAFASAKKRTHAARTERASEPAPVISDAPAHAPIMPIVSVPAANTADVQATKFLAVDGAAEAPVALTAPRAIVVEEEVKAPVAVPAAVETPAPPAPVAPTQPSKSAELSAAEPMAAPALAPEMPATEIAVASKRSEAVASKPSEDAPAAPAPVAAEPVAPAPIIVEEKPATATAEQVPLPLPAAPVRDAKNKPVSLFVSLKDGKLYARQGMEALFDMPISVANPEQPLGTHVFTAMAAKDGGGLRWTVVSIPSNTKRTVELGSEERPHKKHRERAANKIEQPEPPLPGAAEALERIVLPQAAMERIAGLVLPGSSLIVSDNRLSDETNNSTEFIVMTR